MANALDSPRKDAGFIIEASPLIRGLDLIASGFGLLVLAPLFLVIGLVIRFTSAGPAFYRAERVGQGGRLYKLYKFRSMYVGADQSGLGVTVKNDPRITPVGLFLRRTKLDELPQLINVFLGEMSLVGPRPEDPQYVALYSPEQRQVLAVRPGITSPASLRYQGEEALLSGDDWEHIYKEQILPHKLALDLAYLRRRTVWTDLLLILKTIAVLIHISEGLRAVLKLRNRHVFMFDVLALSLVPALALTLRLDGLHWWPEMIRPVILYTGAALLVKLPIFSLLKLYNRYWRYAGVSDLAMVASAVGLSTTILTALFIGMYATLEQYGLAMYRTVPLIDGLLTGLAVSMSRFGLRGLYHWYSRRQRGIGGRRVLVVGAGEAGVVAVHEMWANPKLDMEPVAFVDDDAAKVGTRIQGLPVAGSSEQISELVEQLGIQRIVVAIPSVALKQQCRIMDLCEQTGVATHKVPGVYEILAGHKTISRLPKVDINQLLRREPVNTDQTEVAACLEDAKVLVTGAGGSIGGELCRQIARCNPAEIILLGHGENSIFEIGLDLRISFPYVTTHQVIADVRDERQIDWVIKKHSPDIIFHAAAHKHVPFMEAYVKEAIINNILGTWNVVRAAEQYGVERFVLISTDKAVNPVNVMGATKRLAEMLTVSIAQRSGQAYMAVRFGNVLGSRGSVIPVFQQQIATGGPLTITHPDMRRYFMTIPEAVQLVLQASQMGQGGEIFVLDMGQQVRILDLATDLIKLSGLEPERDIGIVYTGIRPGEKLSEELFLEGEDYRRTKHHRIFVASCASTVEAEVLEQMTTELINLTRHIQSRNSLERIRDLLPEICHYIDDSWPRPQLLLPDPDVTPDTSATTPVEPRREGTSPVVKAAAA
jgi:FlaA1/EpsC-like NDP-sugar epimerase/lipopolysaccharide/colanic/teichoic acid biosynthesis glycosyltransferase